MRKFVFFFIFFTNFVYSSQCEVVKQNETFTKEGMNYLQEYCFSFTGLSFSSTLISFDPTTAVLGDYSVSIYNNSGHLKFSATVKAKGDINFYAFPKNEANTLTVKIKPLASGVNYNFDILYDKNNVNNSNVIVIVPRIFLPVTAYTPPPSPSCNPHNQICINPLASSLAVTEEAAQCNDLNRPPADLPKERDSNAYLDINKELKNTYTTYQSLLNQNVGDSNAIIIAESWAFSRMYLRHKVGAELDVKSDKSKYYNGDPAVGNFIYGAMMQVLGFSEISTQRFSAAYQPIESIGKHAFPLGIYNYVTNSGDNFGDKAEVTRGWKYAAEVWKFNKDSSYLSSCISTAVKENYVAGKYGGMTDPSTSPSGIFWGGASFCRETGSVCTNSGATCTHWTRIIPCSQL